MLRRACPVACTDEVHDLCQMLLKFEEDGEAADLQALLSSLLHTVESAKKEIWSPEATQPSQTVSAMFARSVYNFSISICLGELEVVCHVEVSIFLFL